MHGTLADYRLQRLIKYSFYKNITFAFMFFFYQAFNGVSGQVSTDIDPWKPPLSAHDSCLSTYALCPGQQGLASRISLIHAFRTCQECPFHTRTVQAVLLRQPWLR